MKVVLWLTSGSYLRCDGWGERSAEDLTTAERELLAATALTMKSAGPLAIVMMLGKDGDPTIPTVVNLDHVMTVSPIR